MSSASPSPLTCVTTIHDADWLALPTSERESISRWISCLRAIPSGLKTSGSNSIFDYIVRRVGVTKSTAMRKYYAWRKSQDWRVLVDGRVTATKIHRVGVHCPAFEQWALRILESNNRSTRQAIKEIKARLLSGAEIIPGFESWNSRLNLPPGMSDANLYRLLSRDKMSTLAARMGDRAALSKYGPYVRTTRKGLSVGSQYMFDDVWHDNYITYQGKPVRALEFGAHDVFSGCRFAFGMMPRLHDTAAGQESSKFKGLTGYMFRAFLANVLTTYGYNPHGTLLMMEHGTATLSRGLIESLADRTGGVIQVGMGGLGGHGNALIGGWSGRSSGNPRYKSMIECIHSLIHNVLGMLHGQTGHNRNQPESTDGIVAYQRILSTVVDKLGIKWDTIQSPLLPHDMFYLVCRDLYEVINARTDHALEGWRECGHVINEYRLTSSDELWTPESALASGDKDNQALALTALHHIISADPRRQRERNLSPLEVWDAGKPCLAKLPLDLYALLLGPEGTKDRRVNRGYIHINDTDISPDTLIYSANMYGVDGVQRQLTHGERYGTIINPYALNELLIIDARGGILGKVYRDSAISRADTDGVKSAMGKVAALKAAALEPLRHRHGQDRANVEAMREHNKSIIAEARGALPAPNKRLKSARNHAITTTASGEYLPDLSDFS